jgi:hypothetical protein
MAEPKTYVFVDPTQLPAIPYRIPDPYVPPPEIAATADRFWAHVEPTDFHELWTHKKTRFLADGHAHSIWNFAYLSKVDEIYPGLVVRAICGHERCVHPGHLRPRWPKNRAWPTIDLVFIAFHAERRFREQRRRHHRDLWDEKGIAEAYSLPIDLVIEWWREFRSRFPTQRVE